MTRRGNAVRPAYVADGADSPLRADPELYGPIGKYAARRTHVESHVLPVRSGGAWLVPAGHVCRFTTVDGPQVVDVNLWNAANARERFWAARTRQFHGAHVSTGARLWSCLPYLRPLATIVDDTVGYGLDADGAGCHDLLGSRCDPYVNQLLAGFAYDFHCHSNLVRAIAGWGLTEFDVHDVINLFQVTGLSASDERYFMKSSPAKPGDHLELFAEIDLLIAASTCPGGDLSVPLWGPGADAEPICNPIQVDIFKLDSALLDGWTPPACVDYQGATGVRHGHGQPADPPPPLRPGQVRHGAD